MEPLTIILICFAVFCLCMALWKATSKGEKKLQQKQIEKAQAQFTPEQLKYLQTVGSLYKQNKIMDQLQIYEACGMPHEVAYSRNSQLIDEYIPFEKGSDSYNVFMTYMNAVNKRHALAYSPLFEHPNDVLNINLHANEKIYHVIYNVTFYQEKTTVTNIAYSGLRWHNGPLTAGNLNVISNEYTHFAPVDAGHLIFTNERLIFLGKQKNVTKQVKLSDILYNNMYQDGVMVHIPNRKPLLFKFTESKDFDIWEISDCINEFALAYDRLSNGTQSLNFAEQEQFVNTEDHIDIVKALQDKNFDPLVAEVITMAKNGEPASTSAIQRKYEIGFNRAGKIMDQLESLMMVSPFENGRRVWRIDGDDLASVHLLIEAAKPALY